MKCDTQDWGREGAQSVRAFSLVFLFNVEGWLLPGGISALSKCFSHGQNSFVSDCSQAPQPHPEKWSHRGSAEPWGRCELPSPLLQHQVHREVFGSFVTSGEMSAKPG